MNRLWGVLNSIGRHSGETRRRGVALLDAGQLDEELVQLLIQPLSQNARTFNITLLSNFEPELIALIRLVLFKLSVCNRGASYGASLQGLRLVRSRVNHSNPSRNLLACYAILSILVPYAHTKLRRYALAHYWPDFPSDDARRRIYSYLAFSESFYLAVTFTCFLNFLWVGAHPGLVERLLGLTLNTKRLVAVDRQVSFEFMNRQLVWQAFTEFILFAIPVFDLRRLVRRLFKQSISTNGRLFENKSTTRKYLPKEECAICWDRASISTARDVLTAASTTDDGQITARFALQTPYVTTCGHAFCYMCIAEKLLVANIEGDGPFSCPRCDERVMNIFRQLGEPDSELEKSEIDSGKS